MEVFFSQCQQKLSSNKVYKASSKLLKMRNVLESGSSLSSTSDDGKQIVSERIT